MRVESQTVMGAAMRRAGIDDAPSRLMALACECLRANDGDIARASRDLNRKACDDSDLVRSAFAAFVQRLSESMSGKDLSGGGPKNSADADTGRIASAVATQSSERPTGQSRRAADSGLSRNAGWRSPLAEDDGQSVFADDGRECNATSSAPYPDAIGVNGVDGHRCVGARGLDALGPEGRPSGNPSEPGIDGRTTPARNPNPPRGADVIARIQPAIGKSMFDRWKLADGTPWSAVCYRELFGLARDGGIASLLLKEIPQPRDDGTKLPELLSETRFAQIVATAGGRAA